MKARRLAILLVGRTVQLMVVPWVSPWVVQMVVLSVSQMAALLAPLRVESKVVMRAGRMVAKKAGL